MSRIDSSGSFPRSNKTGVNQKRFYRHLIGSADRLYDSHLATLRARKKGTRD